MDIECINRAIHCRLTYVWPDLGSFRANPLNWYITNNRRLSRSLLFFSPLLSTTTKVLFSVTFNLEWCFVIKFLDIAVVEMQICGCGIQRQVPQHVLQPPDVPPIPDTVYCERVPERMRGERLFRPSSRTAWWCCAPAAVVSKNRLIIGELLCYVLISGRCFSFFMLLNPYFSGLASATIDDDFADECVRWEFVSLCYPVEF